MDFIYHLEQVGTLPPSFPPSFKEKYPNTYAMDLISLLKLPLLTVVILE